jgi:coproporphyrinogen III oxidase-like Fe-S oxidoreductase
MVVSVTASAPPSVQLDAHLVRKLSQAGPRYTVSPERIHSLRAQGFNRISLGVQDFDAEVPRAVNRVQPEAETRAIVAAAREAQFRSAGIDLIYSLPKQRLLRALAASARRTEYRARDQLIIRLR